MQSLVDLDLGQNMALVVVRAEGRREEIVAMTRYDVDPATNLADIAFVVRDEWQGQGLGTLLLRRMGEIASDRGVAGFTADILATNKPMLAIFQRSGLKLRMQLEAGVYHLVARFAGNP
jgi:GNAT superfamily N-acetyltransferase